MDFDKFIDKETLTADVPKLINYVRSRSQAAAPPNHTLQSKVDELRNSTHNVWHICCGHDLVCILALGLCKALGTHNTQAMVPENVEKLLRLAYEHSHFAKTLLYAALQQWERANQPFVVLQSG